MGTAWRNEPSGTPWSSVRSAKSCTYGITILCTCIWQGLPSWKAAWPKGTSGSWWIPSRTEMCPWCKDSQWYPGLHKTKHFQLIKRGHPSTLFSAGEAPSGVFHPVLGSSSQERDADILAYWREFKEEAKGWLRDWSTSHVRKGWDSWDHSASVREGSEGILLIYKNT